MADVPCGARGRSKLLITRLFIPQSTQSSLRRTCSSSVLSLLCAAHHWGQKSCLSLLELVVIYAPTLRWHAFQGHDPWLVLTPHLFLKCLYLLIFLIESTNVKSINKSMKTLKHSNFKYLKSNWTNLTTLFSWIKWVFRSVVDGFSSKSWHFSARYLHSTYCVKIYIVTAFYWFKPGYCNWFFQLAAVEAGDVLVAFVTNQPFVLGFFLHFARPNVGVAIITPTSCLSPPLSTLLPPVTESLQIQWTKLPLHLHPISSCSLWAPSLCSIHLNSPYNCSHLHTFPLLDGWMSIAVHKHVMSTSSRPAFLLLWHYPTKSAWIQVNANSSAVNSAIVAFKMNDHRKFDTTECCCPKFTSTQQPYTHSVYRPLWKSLVLEG